MVPKTSYTTNKAKVLKVYTATDAPYTFSAYVVEWSGAEVIVTDPISKSSHKVGDTIEFMAQKIDLGGTTHALTFTLLN